ncbi:MAG: phosphopyruvate hydratase [Bryobacteraceae bacterium]|nr:phosphopyruvate hydratase [Bryobacteraceae bacterium]
MSAILRVRSLEVLDSRGRPTVEAEVALASGALGSAISPSGASTGKHEALELRDGDPERYGGLGVRKAVRNVEEVIAPAVTGLAAQEELDAHLREVKHLGANATLAVSMAMAHALAAEKRVPLWRSIGAGLANGPVSIPVPMVNLISGGLHAGRNLDLQDFLIIPAECASFAEAIERVVTIYNRAKKIVEARGLSSLKADEGGFSPALPSNEAALELAMEAAGGDKILIALDVAATHFHSDGYYRFARDNRTYSASNVVDLLEGWCAKYPIVSIEDGLAEDDWEGWRLLTERLGEKVQLIGDDLFTTNPARVQRGIGEKCANAVLVKMNQIGTLTETLEVIALAKANGYRTVVSARSGETEDTTMSDLAVATGAGQIKVGSVNQSERLAKYNRLLRIEREGVPYARIH